MNSFCVQKTIGFFVLALCLSILSTRLCLASKNNLTIVQNDATPEEVDFNDCGFPLNSNDKSSELSVQVHALVTMLNQKIRDSSKGRLLVEEELIGDGQHHVHDFMYGHSKWRLRSNL